VKPRAFFEIGPLLQEHWTGITIVTAAIAEHALSDPSIDWTFFYNTLALPREFVEGMVRQRSNAGGFDFLRDHAWRKQDIGFEEAGAARAVFPYIKTFRGMFGEEAIFVHDLSPLLTPQFHSGEAIGQFADRFRHDVETSKQFFCNSEATRGDLVAYFGVDPRATDVVPMGATIDPAALSAAQLAGELHATEPYVVVLGTLEPRKNGALILRFLAKDPDFARRHRVVFIGRQGWLDENQKLLDEIETAGLPRDRIVFTGFISEAEKIALLYNAAFCIYASYFEGYGLPILEAAALGKLIVCSNSSSMPEVAPEQCFFFDPADLAQFSRAMSRAAKRAPHTRSPTTLDDIADRLQGLGWDRCYGAIADWVKS